MSEDSPGAKPRATKTGQPPTALVRPLVARAFGPYEAAWASSNLDFVMPTYIYEVLSPKGEGTGRHFEYVQSMSDKALTKHPETGEPVRRVPVLPAIAGQMSDLRKGKLTDRKLEKLGFTQYARQRDGSYERRFGKFGTPTIPKADD